MRRGSRSELSGTSVSPCRPVFASGGCRSDPAEAGGATGVRRRDPRHPVERHPRPLPHVRHARAGAQVPVAHDRTARVPDRRSDAEDAHTEVSRHTFPRTFLCQYFVDFRADQSNNFCVKKIGQNNMQYFVY